MCTDLGLLVAASGGGTPSEALAVLASLFDDVVGRAQRDMGMQAIDELTLLDGARGRFVIRPLPLDEGSRMFLVVHVPAANRWRRTTNRLCGRLQAELADLGGSAGVRHAD
ncbi:MAG: hypothetical protein V4850_05605 [Myxococcota bacterium]